MKPQALHNSQLLKTYRLLDRRVAPLILAVKRWAARREIHDGLLVDKPSFFFFFFFFFGFCF